jgi:hypothetical protein
MNLYTIYQTVNSDYDTFDSAVVAAENPLSAQATHPNGEDAEFNARWTDHSWCNIQDVEVTLLGKAKAGTKAGVICASFNAG